MNEKKLPGHFHWSRTYHRASDLPFPREVCLYPSLPSVEDSCDRPISVTLPKVKKGLTSIPLERVLLQRQSHRHFRSDRSLSLEAFSHFLFFSAGIRGRRRGIPRRTYPSAGALYPLEVYLLVHQVETLEPGVYHYHPRRHALCSVRSGDCREASASAALDQEFLATAAFVVCISAFLPRIEQKYRQRSYRYALIEAGHLGQNVYLVAEALGLGACAVGAFWDTELAELLAIPSVRQEQELPLYLLAVGFPSVQ